MLILPEYNKPYTIDSLTAPIVVKHHWVFSAPQTDFMLQAITYLEETQGAAVKVRINNSEFWVPATWNILVTDRETYQLDTVSIADCAKTKHIAFSFSFVDKVPRPENRTVLFCISCVEIMLSGIRSISSEIPPSFLLPSLG